MKVAKLAALRLDPGRAISLNLLKQNWQAQYFSTATQASERDHPFRLHQEDAIDGS